jgi:hypothetical protein
MTSAEGASNSSAGENQGLTTPERQETGAMKSLLGRLSLACGIVLALMMAVSTPSEAWSRGHDHHFRGDVRVWWGPRVVVGPPVVFGPPVVWARPYPYSYGRSVVVESPPTYVHQDPAASGHWYYCQSPQGYYPYVQQCPGGWLQVAPTPPPQ